jgi:DNA-binding response OmpR family regulator
VLAIDDERRMREYVRRKFEGGASNKILHTVRGVGYVLRSGGP